MDFLFVKLILVDFTAGNGTGGKSIYGGLDKRKRITVV